MEMNYFISGLSYLIVSFIIYSLQKPFHNVLFDKTKNWYFYISIPLIFLVLVVDIVNWGASNGILVVSNANGAEYWNIYHNQIFSNIAICILTTLSMCIAGGCVFGMNKIYVEQRKQEQYHSQIAFYKMLEEQYLQMERLRHDMKNHFIGLQGLWANKEYEKLGSYLEKMMKSGNLGTNDDITGNSVLDALLYDKRKWAEEKEILWKCDIQFSRICPIDEFDLCVLFGNILDNALYACEEINDNKYRFVDIQAKKVKKCFLLEVKNGTDMNDTSEIKHGIGLLNINETVKKYNGVVNVSIEKNIFDIAILLPINEK